MSAPSGAGVDALAIAAVEEIRSGMTVGLGTGRAAARAIEALAHRATAERLHLVCVATSLASARMARGLGLHVSAMEGIERVDYLFDGADEVDPALRMLKGRGGAMTREKIVAQAADRRVYLVQAAKLVGRLGESAPLPIELLRFGLAAERRALVELGLESTLRRVGGERGAGTPFETDGGNPVVDAELPDGVDLAALAAALDATPGVVGHGLFLDEADLVLVEDADGRVSRRVRSPARA
ncbi:MAG TPA: ribose-5-phosphate isomerase RpiA [Kofleriaceae bacterium]|nr:ribose-5-phosphate isomerase RpiA [Kofleriaceae bacterium]